MRPITADFLGALKLEGEVDQSNPTKASGGIVIKPIDDLKDESFQGIDLCIDGLKESYISVIIAPINHCYVCLVAPDTSSSTTYRAPIPANEMTYRQAINLM